MPRRVVILARRSLTVTSNGNSGDGTAFSWRRMAASLQRGLAPLDGLGSRPRAAASGHTLMLTSRRPA